MNEQRILLVFGAGSVGAGVDFIVLPDFGGKTKFWSERVTS